MKFVFFIEKRMLNDSDWGGGKGLAFEIKKMIEKNNDIDVIYVEPPKGKIRKFIYGFGGYITKRVPIDYESVDKIIVYPSRLFWIIPSYAWDKTIVLGSDSLVFNASSLYRATENRWRKYMIRRPIICFSKIEELMILKRCRKYIVVGNTDKKYMIHIYKMRELYKRKIKFMHHPLLSHEQQNIKIYTCPEKDEGKIFVFSGDWAKRYQEACIKRLVSYLNEKKSSKVIKIVVVGKNNKWIVELLKNIPIVDVTYIKFIKNYLDICKPGRNVHCIPMASGSGTKNRTLTAISNGLEVIATPIGMENIKWKGLSHIYIHKNMNRFADAMINVNNHVFEDVEFKEMISKRLAFLEKMDKIKKEEIKEYIINN